MNSRKVVGRKLLLRALEDLRNECPEFQESLNQMDSLLEKRQQVTDALAEQYLWPAKIRDARIPCFIVPIRPQWARELFDEDLASQDLFGPSVEVALNVENVYYRNARPQLPKSPARVLWYVTKERKINDSGAVRACSQVREVSIDVPRSMFRRYQRLGVYKWKEVIATAGGDANQPILGFRFSHTELFKSPISWKKLQEILEEQEGHRNQLQAPVKISPKTFFQVYSVGSTM